jgi:pyruvate dehydrogenase E2 component (dihydrolipoamide acetyltransferase)
MAIEIRVPRLGWNMEEGVFLAWLKKDGDVIKPGDAIFTIEGDKAVQDVEATDSGILRIDPNGPSEGDTVPVGTLLGYLVEAGETHPVTAVPVHDQQPAIVSPTLAPVVVEPIRHETDLPTISPRARRVAHELNVDWTHLRGSGRTGRIRERDIRPAGPRTQPAAGTRRTIASKMLTSLHSTAPVTLTTTADASNLVNLRRQFQAAPSESVPSYTDFIVKLTGIALQAHPNLNARWEDEAVLVLKDIHIGIAVDTESGLLVPVIRDVPTLSLRELAVRSRELIDRAHTRKLTADEMQGGTFTVSNLGAFGIDAFTPIINYPECAILGIGRIHRQPAVVGDQVVAREQVTLSLTFDHRIVDGAPAARFLDMLRKCIENPGPWLMT